MSNSKEYNFASWKKKEPEIIKTYDTSNPPEYKLHLQYPKGWRYLMYKPHTSELTENGIPVSLESINMDYTKGHFHEWIPNSPSNPAKKSDKPNNVKIQMGLKCNYSCSYCNQATQVPNSFQGNPAEAQKFLDELDTWFKGDGNKTRWEFWGGEPLVYIKVLKVLAEGIRKKYPKAEFNIITNASMLTPEIVDWLDSLDFQVGISHDGAVYRDQRGEDILCKPETLAAVKYAYNKLFPKGRIGFNCVLTVKNYSLHKVREYIAEKMGFTGNKIIDTDQATYMEILLNTLPSIIPCQECQAHSAAYIQGNPVPTLRGLYGQELRQATRQWLFLFHQAVRIQKGQDILVATVEDCAVLYDNCAVPKCEYTSFIQSVSAAVRQGWVRIDQWRKWYSYSERLRIISGNIVV